MTPETAAQNLADALAAAEAAAANVTAKTKVFAQVMEGAGMQPFTQKRIILLSQAAQSAIYELHAALNPLDPRVTTQDGGGK